jgi:Xaa-Pro aminopeptidase
MERWDGPRMRPGPEAKRATGIAEIRPIGDLPDQLDRLLVGRARPALALPLYPEEIGLRILDASYPVIENRRKDPFDGGTWREDRQRLKLAERYPSIDLKDASPALRALREFKGPEEIEAMREAGRISCLGMIAAIRAAKPGAFEYELEAAMAAVCRRLGGQGWAYGPIVGSGPNALIMHYNRNERRMEAGDTVLMDAGFSWNYYAMDITRCFPVSGRFSAAQRKAYDDLLKVQVEIVERVRPGISLLELHNMANRRLKALGYGKALVHFLGHFVGLAVHDPGVPARPLRAGHVITIEPGIYLEHEGFGFRIEDTVLVTADGSEVLSAGVPKDAETMEALVQGK